MPRKRQQDLLDRLIASFSLRGFLLHQATLFVVASMLVVGSAVFLWENHKSTIVDPEAYRLTAEKISISPPPQWATEDLTELILRNDSEQPRSMLDPLLVSETANRMQQVGFVEGVREIRKSKVGLQVELNYRVPVATVELSPDTVPELKQIQPPVGSVLLPVDRNGVLLPKDIVLNPGLPKIYVLYPAGIQSGQNNALHTWSDLNDHRIDGAAAIAERLLGQQLDVGIERIVTFSKPETAEAAIEFEFWSPVNALGTVVIWGAAPGNEAENEASAHEKILALKAYVEQYGKLDVIAHRRIDIRTGVAREVPKDKTASMSAFAPQKLF